MSIRTFIAVDVSSGVRNRAAELCSRLQASEAKVNWTDPDNLHLTLKFLGDVEDPDVVQVCSSVKAACEPQGEFSIFLAGAGAFPKPERPRTLWIGVREGVEELRTLHTAIDHELRKLGFPREPRRYHPHLTIGRLRSSGRQDELSHLIDENEQFEVGAAQIDEVVVYASYLDKGGPTYEALARCPL